MKPNHKFFLTIIAIITSITSLHALSDEEMDKFILGKSFFETPWVEAPSATTARDGLGPLYSANTCLSCHPHNGRGSVYNTKGQISRSLVTRLSIKSKNIDAKKGFIAEPTYGAQLSINSIYGVPFEGETSRYYIDKVVTNGWENIILHKPVYGVSQLHYGKLAKDVVISQRVALGLLGLGFLEQLSDAQILANEDIDDKNNDGISGKANRVYSLETSHIEIGRYTHKASVPSIKHQVAGAFHNDMGLTSPLYPNDNCTKSQKKCLTSPKGINNYDVPMKRLNAVSFYIQNLQAPKTKKSQLYKDGLKIFKQISCSACHITSFTLKSAKIIHPFSDLLLHDMGEGLADGRVEFKANGNEFRSTPLWGISIYKSILKDRMNYLHDGRAKTIQEAILWHSGEAQKAKDNFKKLQPKQQKLLIDFLEIL